MNFIEMFLKSLVETFVKLAWKMGGYKIVRNEYEEREEIVKIDYVESSPQCQAEMKKGNEFGWSKTFSHGLERYYQIIDNKKVSFKTSGGDILWIKRKY